MYFRSRLEARWAVFYDRLGIKYEYEKEGYDLGNGIWYLPDFWLPDQKCFVEIKPTSPNKEENLKAEKLARQSGYPVCIAMGQIEAYGTDNFPNKHDIWFSNGCWDDSYLWCQCPDCGKFGIEFDGRSDRLPCKEPICCAYKKEYHNLPEEHYYFCKHEVHPGGCQRHGNNYDKGYNSESDEILIAYRIARCIRFEEVHKPIWEHFIDPVTGYGFAKRIHTDRHADDSREDSAGSVTVPILSKPYTKA